ncbi:MAG: metal ABC transporter ATP-binding protein [Candidatus Caldarchaeum sp.]|nr:metal ABC transporter ATP-binding protein [Candidatus Caldarchaeum sp.]MDW8360274.1 metal ABC transporter ATP-binding protein [Candidatus Caldarchaeum sp.]
MEAVKAEGLTVVYGRLKALDEVSFTIPSGSMTAVIGPNGSGKSTLLKTLIGLVKPAAGSFKVLGSTIDKMRGKVAYVPQREEVYWEYPLTVWDVVALGRIKAVGPLRPVRKGDRVVSQSLERAGIESLKSRRLSELSGGQQQRIFLARAMAQEADLYLMDEPLTGIDAEAEDRLLDILSDLRREGKTIVMTTHDLSSTLELFDNVLVLKNRLIAFGRPEEALKTENLVQAYGSERVAMHLSDVRRVAGWR